MILPRSSLRRIVFSVSGDYGNIHNLEMTDASRNLYMDFVAHGLVQKRLPDGA